MNKGLKVAAFVFVGFLSFLWIEKPLREFLISFNIDEIKAKYSSAIAVRTVLIYFSYTIINKMKLENFNSLNFIFRHTNIQAIFVPVVLILAGIFSNLDTYSSSEFGKFILFSLSVISVGIVEEFIFRGTIFPLIINELKNYKRPILLGAILSSSLFGIVHFINLLSQPENLVGITSQVFFAFSIGMFFSGLMVRTENILIPAFIHALINFSFGSGELKTVAKVISTTNGTDGANWNSIIPTAIFFAFIMAGGVYMILKCSEKGIMEKLELD